jgi:hypothetical protein
MAEFVLPRHPHTAVYEVNSRSNAHEFARKSANEPRMSASISIQHLGTVDAPPDGCQQACRDEIILRLRAIGAMEGA